VDVPDDYRSYRIICPSKAQQELLSQKATDANIELLTDLVLEFKAHENEIRKIRQELEIQVQRYKMNKLRKL
jgi:hypothetical protein